MHTPSGEVFDHVDLQEDFADFDGGHCSSDWWRREDGRARVGDERGVVLCEGVRVFVANNPYYTH